jgi:hypothetical protein
VAVDHWAVAIKEQKSRELRQVMRRRRFMDRGSGN